MTVQSSELISNTMRLQNREFVYTAKFRIKCSRRDMSAYAVVSGAVFAGPHPFPAYFSTYSLSGVSDASSFMQSCDVQPLSDEDSSVFIANATWSPIKDSESDDDHTSRENPLNRAPIYSLEWEEVSRPVENAWNQVDLPGVTDFFGLPRATDTFGPIQNAAGQEPSTPILKSKRIPVIVVEKNYATLDAINAVEKEFGDSLNDATFNTYKKGECAFRGIRASKPKFEGGVAYYTGTIRIACQVGGWNYEMVNRGWSFLNDDGDLQEATFKGENGEVVPVAEPINLAIDGKRLEDGKIGTVIDYRLSPFKNYSELGI